MWSKLRTSTTLGAVALGLALTAAAAAQVCHPDLAGTRSLTVSGAVTSYGFTKDGVVVAWTRSHACAGTAVWSFGAGMSAKANSACTHAGATLKPVATKLEARRGDTIARVRLAPAGADRADRLDILSRSTHRQLASWPLIDRPTRVALYGDLAVLSTAKRHAVYVLRITDGRIALIGITQPGDRPTIGPAGLLYQDDVHIARDRDARGRLLDPTQRTVRLLLVPLATLNHALDNVGAVQVSDPISGFSMDGPRVAYGVTDPNGVCDRVQFWNIPWRFVSVLTQQSGASCLPAHAPGGITNVAIAGSRAIWTTTYGSVTRVLAASIIECEDWVVARPAGGEQVTGLAGDGPLLAYTVAGSAKSHGLSSVGLVPRTWGGVAIASSPDRTLALSADAGRVAALGASGVVTISAPGNGVDEPRPCRPRPRDRAATGARLRR